MIVFLRFFSKMKKHPKIDEILIFKKSEFFDPDHTR